MRFDVITIFPEMFDALQVSQIWKRAVASGLIDFHLHDLREFTDDPHRTVDDVPYGGGPGMVLKVEPLVRAIENLEMRPRKRVLYTSPQGRRLNQAWVEELAAWEQIIVVAGRYEGVDERFVDGWVDESFSIGDYVLSGGELAAQVLMDAVARVIPGVVGDPRSVTSDSFSSGRLKFPQYTRPAEYRGRKVPDVLLSGHHEHIEQWRIKMAEQRTAERRPDLLPKAVADTGKADNGLSG